MRVIIIISMIIFFFLFRGKECSKRCVVWMEKGKVVS